MITIFHQVCVHNQSHSNRTRKKSQSAIQDLFQKTKWMLTPWLLDCNCHFLNFLSQAGVMSLLKPVRSEYFFLYSESYAFLSDILIYYFNWKKDQHWLAEPTSNYIHLWWYSLTKEKQQSLSCTWYKGNYSHS